MYTSLVVESTTERSVVNAKNYIWGWGDHTEKHIQGGRDTTQSISWEKQLGWGHCTTLKGPDNNWEEETFSRHLPETFQTHFRQLQDTFHTPY